MSTETWPIKRLLEWTEKYLQEKGIENPRLDAQILLAFTLGCQRIDLYVRSNEEPNEKIRNDFKALIRRRVEGCPVAYLVGQREFYLFAFLLSNAVLIPRPETEFLVMEALHLLKAVASPFVLDLGTGSGCIALTIAQQKTDAIVTATDLSEAALAMARKNAEKMNIAEKIEFRLGDLFQPVVGQKFDLIASNPPYIASGEITTLMPEVKNHEPLVALDGGPDGLAIIRRLINDSHEYLKDNGKMLIEIGIDQDVAVREIVENTKQVRIMTIKKDGQQIPRVVVIEKA